MYSENWSGQQDTGFDAAVMHCYGGYGEHDDPISTGSGEMKLECLPKIIINIPILPEAFLTFASKSSIGLSNASSYSTLAEITMHKLSGYFYYYYCFNSFRITTHTHKLVHSKKLEKLTHSTLI